MLSATASNVSVDIDLLDPPRTNLDRVAFGVTLSGEPVSLQPEHISLTGSLADASTFDVTPDGDGYRIAVTPADPQADGLVGIRVDAPGEQEPVIFASEQYTIDNTPPTVTVDQHPSQPDPAHRLPITYEVWFSEDVTDFDAGDVNVSGDAQGVAITVQGEDNAYRVFVTRVSAGGAIELSVGADAAHDMAGNGNEASTSTDNSVAINLASQSCELTAVQILTPGGGSRVIVGPGRYPVGMHFAAATDCESRTLFVEYAIGGFELGRAFEPPYRISVSDVFSLFEPGTYTVRAAAIDQRSGQIVAETVSEFTLERALSAEDPERDGFPNYPDQSLSEAGDLWLSTARQAPTSGLRTIAVQRLPLEHAADAAALIALNDPDLPHVRASARVPLLPLSESPGGLFVMAMAKDPVALFDETAMRSLAFEPLQGMVAGGSYIFMNYLAPGAAAAKANDASAALFAGSPIELRVDGLPIQKEGMESFYAHPASISRMESGVRIAPEPGEWDKAPFGEMANRDGAMEAELLQFALVAPFNSPLVSSAQLSVQPSTIDFGAVRVYRSAEAEFTIANNGGAMLEGTFTAPPPFEVAGGGDYAIEPGGTRIIRIRFAPDAPREFVVVGRASGAQTRSVTLKGRGMMSEGPAGCAAIATATDTPRQSRADTLVVALALAVVAVRRGRAGSG